MVAPYLVFLLIAATVAQNCQDCPSCGPVVNPVFPLANDQSCQAKVVLILDESGSLNDFREIVSSAAVAFWTALGDFASLGGSAQLGVVEFSTDARIVGQPFLRTIDSAYLEELNTYISTEKADATGYSPHGTTNWGQALDLTFRTFTGINQPDLVVFFTDGSPNGHAPFVCDFDCYAFDNFAGDVGNACYKADTLKSRGIKLFTVGLGAAAARDFSIPLLGGGDSAIAWNLQPDTFGEADYVLNPDLSQLLPTLTSITTALCPPPCEPCLISCSDTVTSPQECTGPFPPTLPDVVVSKSGECGAEARFQAPLTFVGSCKRGTVTRSVQVQNGCDASGAPQECLALTEITDTVGPVLSCPADAIHASCTDALCALQTLSATASDVCSEAFVSKGEITPVTDANGDLMAYTVEFTATDGCDNVNADPCVVTYECRDNPAPQLTKMAFYRPAVAGGAPVEWSGTATNAGPGVLRGAAVTDQVAAGTRITSTLGKGATTLGNTVRFQLGDVPALQPEPYAIWFGVPASSTENSIVNSATLADAAVEFSAQATASVDVVRLVDTWISINEACVEGFAGEGYTLTVSYGNFGPSDSGPMALQWTPVSNDGSSTAGGVAPSCTTSSWTSIAAHARGTITCSGLISQTGLYAWKAELLATSAKKKRQAPTAQLEVTSHNNVDTLPIFPKPQISVGKRRVSATEDTVLWEIIVTNNSPAPITLETLVDTLYSVDVSDPSNPRRHVSRVEALQGCSALLGATIAPFSASPACTLSSFIDLSGAFWFGEPAVPIASLQFVNEVRVVAVSGDSRRDSWLATWDHQRTVLTEAQTLARVVGDTLSGATTVPQVTALLSSVGTTSAFIDVWLALAASGYADGVTTAYGLQTALAKAASDFLVANSVDVFGHGVRRAPSLSYATATGLDTTGLALSEFDRDASLGSVLLQLFSEILRGISGADNAVGNARFLGAVNGNITVVLSGDAVFTQVAAYGYTGAANVARRLAAAEISEHIARIQAGCPTEGLAQATPLALRLCLTEVSSL